MNFTFLGQTARCDIAPALLAARMGAPLVLSLGRRFADGTHFVDAPLVLQPPPSASIAWAREATRAMQAELERFVLEHPSQWLWMHRRWHDAPAAPGPKGAARELAGSAPLC